MDPSIQAAWIGVSGSLVGAVVGAVVGGSWATRAATNATAEQWAREERSRHEEALGNELRLLFGAMQRFKAEKAHVPRRVLLPIIGHVSIAGNLAESSHPALADRLKKCADDLVDDDPTVRRSAILELVNVCLNWMQDPTYGTDAV